MPKTTSELTLEIKNLQKNLNQAIEEIKYANKMFKAETNGMDKWSETSEGLEAKIKQLASVLKSQEKALQTYNQMLEAQNKESDKWRGKVDEAKKALEELEKNGVDKASDAYKEWAKTLSDNEYLLQSSEKKAKQYQLSIAEQEGAIRKTKAELVKYGDAQEELANKHDSITDVVKKQEKELKALKKEYAETVVQQGKDSDAAKELGKKIQDLSGDLVANKKALDDAQKEADELDQSYQNTGKSAEESGEKVEKSTEKQLSVWQRAKDNFVGGMMVEAVKKSWEGLKNAVNKVVDVMSDAITSGADFADNILTLSSTTGLATDTLQEYAYMEDLIDVSSGTVAKSLKKLTSQMGAADKGTESAQKAFDKLGISIYDANGKLRDSEDVFNDAIDALGEIENETERDAAAMDLFGKSATDLNPLIEAGSEKLEALKQEAHDTGAVLSGDALSALGAAKDGMDRLQQAVDTTKNAFAVGFAPAIASATGTLAESLTNPRTQLAVQGISEWLGDVMQKGADLAADILPKVLSLFGDTRVQQYTEDQIKAYQAMETAKTRHDELVQAYNSNAQDIIGEKQRVEDLWKELEKLVGKNGEVKKADEERVDYILHSLNDALGTEYERNGKIIEQYGEMKQSISDLIQQRTAESLLEAGKEQYTHALQEQSDALSRAANFSADLEVAEQALAEAQAELAKRQAEANEKFDDSEYGINAAMAYTQEYENAVKIASAAVEQLSADYAEAQGEYRKYTADVDRYQRAENEALQGRYEEAVRIMADETGATLEYYQKKHDLAEEEVKELKKLIDQKQRDYEEYEKALNEGAAGHSQERLDQMRKEIEDASLLWFNAKSGAKKAAEDVGKAMGDGVSSGIQSKEKEVEEKVTTLVRKAYKTMKKELDIASPSKKTEELGEFFDLGFAKGISENINSVTKAASAMANDTVDAMNVKTPKINNNGGQGTVNQFTQNIYAPKTPSRIELYRDAQNLIAMAGGMA